MVCHMILYLLMIRIRSVLMFVSSRLIPLNDLPVWARWGAALPAFMAVVLLFLDQNITGMSSIHFRWFYHVVHSDI